MQASTDPEYARRRIAEVPRWWHSIEVAPGVVTPGVKTQAMHTVELQTLALPSLAGKTVLDIGGWDGFYSFYAEEAGARRVRLIDHFVWSLDLAGLQRHIDGVYAAGGRISRPYEETEFWRPDDLPGKLGFDIARELRGSSVEPLVADFMTMPVQEIGTWDVVLFLGVLYHLEDPLRGLRRLAAVTRECALIETEAIAVAARPDASVWEFYPGDELEHDYSNWFVPTAPALTGALQAAGFERVELLVEPPPADPTNHEIVHYRLLARAYKP